MGGKDDGFAVLFDLPDQIPQIATGLGIQSGGRFVQKQQFGLIDQGHGQKKPLPLPTGNFIVVLMLKFAQVAELNQLIDTG
jgi:hypothetical protein